MKKTLKILLVAVLLITLSIPMFASASSRPIEGFSGERSLEEVYNIGQGGSPSDLTIYPGAEIRIPLTADMFEWNNGRSPLPMEAITTSELNRNAVRVKSQLRSASQVLDYVQISTDVFSGRPFIVSGQSGSTGKTAYISVVFAKRIISVKDIPFVIEIRLTANGDVSEDYEITLEGVMSNETVDIYSSTDYVNIQDSIVAEAVNNSQNVKMDLGNGVSITKNAYKGQKYYGFAGMVDNMEIIREAFPDVHDLVTVVYRLETINLRYGNTGVKIDPKLTARYPNITNFFVYNEDLIYLGMTNDNLPYSDLYVVSAGELPEMNQEKYLDGLVDPPNQDRA